MGKYPRPASLDRFKSAEDKLLEQLQAEMLFLCQEHKRRFNTEPVKTSYSRPASLDRINKKMKSPEDQILQEVLDEMHYLRAKYHSHKLKPEKQTEPMGNISVEKRALLLVAELENSGRGVKSVTIKGKEIKVDLVSSEDKPYNSLDYVDFKRWPTKKRK